MLQAQSMLNDELELINSLTSTLSSFKEDPTMGGVARGRPPARAGGGGAKEDPHGPHSRDPDVWPPPTPVESR